MGILIVAGVLCVVHLLVGVYTDHRQTCRKERRQLLASVVAAVHREHLEEGWKADLGPTMTLASNLAIRAGFILLVVGIVLLTAGALR